MDKENLERLRNKYKKGSLIQFLDETCKTVPYGTRGIVDNVNQYGLIHVIWNDGTEMILKDGKDCFQKIEIGTLKYKVPLTINRLNDDFIDEEVESNLLDVDSVNKYIYESLSSEGQIGLAKYLDPMIANKIDSILPSVEEINEEIVGVITINISDELDEQEVEILKQEIEGQLSDGWGEGFEQVPILQGHHEYYVSFFSFELDWKLTQIDSETQNELSISMDIMRGV